MSTNYKAFLEEAKKASKSKNYSKGDMVSLATAMFNDKDCTIDVFIKKGDEYETKVMNPGKSIRENVIAPVLKAFGVDRAEMSKLDDVQISKAGGEALTDFSLLLVKQYISTNGLARKLTLPMTAPDEAVQSISVVRIPEEKRETTMIVRNPESGTYSIAPTGKEVTTAAHENLKVGNRVPAWQKKIRDLK